MRLIVGDGDWLYDRKGMRITERFSRVLREMDIDNSYTVWPGIGHELPSAIADGRVTYPVDFWGMAFADYR